MLDTMQERIEALETENAELRRDRDGQRERGDWWKANAARLAEQVLAAQGEGAGYRAECERARQEIALLQTERDNAFMLRDNASHAAREWRENADGWRERYNWAVQKLTGIGDPDEAEKVVQDTFGTAVQHLVDNPAAPLPNHLGYWGKGQ